MPQGPIPVVVTNTSATGNSWFVNEATGSDTTGNGSAQRPFATLDEALAAATANHNDVVYLSGTSHRSTTLNWNKAGVSLIGLAAPSDNDRARISVLGGLTQTQVTALTPLVNVTAQGCSFVNLGTFYGFDGVLTPPTSSVCWAEAGGRNFYSNVQFLGGGDALMGALAGLRSLTIGGSGENLFIGCTFGLDTVQRITAANATLEIIGGSPRNTIRQGIFQAYNGLATNEHLLVASGGMDRYLLLDDVSFLNFGTTMNAAISNAGGSPGGNIVLTPNCVSVGATAIATTGNVFVSGPVPTATTSNIGILAT